MASAGQGKGMEVFPDLHHKMSKKIAQLTKVIYHLNTKNEDHAVEMEVLSANHQVEIQNILRDAANRIAKFKEMVENRQQSLNQEAKVEKLVKKHEQEKAAALQDLANLKLKLQERKQKISSDYQGKFEGLKREIEAMNKKFQEKLAQLESANQDLVKALADSSRSGSAGMDEQRRKHEAELAEVVRNANEKYQAMLIEQLGIQETLKRDLEARAASEVRLTTERLTTEFDKELGQTRAKMSAEKQEALLQLRRELEQRQAEMRTDFTQRLDRALQDLKSKGDALELLKAQSESRIKELEEKLVALQRSLNDEVGGSQVRTSQLADDLARANDLARSLQAKLTQREEELAALQALLSEKSQVLARLETSLSRAEQDAALLRDALEHAKQSQAHGEEDLLQKLATSQRETASLREEVNTIAMQLHTAREDAKRLDKERSRAAEEYEQRITHLQSEVDSLRATVKDAQAQLAAGSQSASAELDALRRRLADAEERGAAEARRLAMEHSSAMEELRSRHQAAMDEMKSLHASQAQQMGGRVDVLTKELDHLREEHANKMSQLVAEHTRRMEELTKQHEQELASLKNSFLELEQQLAAVGEQAEQDKAALRNEVSRFENKYKTALKELEAKKKESERTESLTNGLKNQIESLREELKASQRAFMQKMDLNTAKLEQDWANRLEQELQRAEAERLQALEAQAQQWASERSQLELAHDEEVKALKLLLQKEAGDAALALAKTERLRESLESQLQQEKAARSSQVSEVTEHLQSQLRAAEESHRLEVERLRREFKSTLEGRETALTEAHNAEMLSQRQRTESELAELARSHAESLQLQRQTAEEGLRAALSALEQQMAQKHAAALEAQSRSFEADKERLLAQHKAQLDQLSNSLDSKIRALEASQQELRGALDTINIERTERQRREEAFALERDQLLRTHTQDLHKERESAERRILEVMERADADIKLLQREHMDVRTKYEERYRDLTREYKLLEERWKNRESRVEDLQRIEMLEKEVADREEEVQRAKEELVICKREMLNREENYNQKFNRSMNVGVMQVIKPKEEPPAGPPKAKPTQMRVINPQTGAGMMAGSGLGLGVGVSPGFSAAPSGPGGSSKGSARSK